MRAIVIHRHGGPEVLTYEAHSPDPVAGPGEMIVRVHACALNPLDIFTREGMPGEPTPLPHITGGDIAGAGRLGRARRGLASCRGPGRAQPVLGVRRVRVLPGRRGPEVHPGPHAWRDGPGRAGGAREMSGAPAIPLPEHYPFEQAACLPITFGTAWRMLVTHARVQPGEDVLVHGAVGGVGLAAIRIAKLAGARSSPPRPRRRSSRRDRARRRRRHRFAEDRDWDATVRRLTGKRGVDVIVETVGAATWERSIRALGKGGRLVTSGATSGPIGPTDIRYLFRREHTIQGSNGWTQNDLLTIMRLAFAGKLRPVVDRVLPLERTAEGERAMEQREVIGKVVIRP